MDESGLFDMGRHGAHVWAALAVTAAVMIALAALSLRRLRMRQAELDRFRTTRGQRNETEA